MAQAQALHAAALSGAAGAALDRALQHLAPSPTRSATDPDGAADGTQAPSGAKAEQVQNVAQHLLADALLSNG